MKKIILFLLLILDCATSLKAQDTLIMNLKECMRYAISHSTKMRIQEADKRDAQINRRDAILAAFTPSVNASSYVYYNFGRSIDPETNIYSQVTSFHNGYSLSAGITLFDGFQAINNMKITKIAQQMGLNQAQLLEDEICLATIEAYCNVIYYTELKKTLISQVNTAETSLRVAERQEQLGQKSHTDVLQLQADLAKCQYRLTNCQNTLDNSMISLKDLMFWPIEEPMKIEESIDLLLSPSLKEKENKLNVRNLIDYAQKNNHKVLIADGKVNQARIALKTARWQFAPSLSLYGGWSTSFFTYPGQKDYIPMPFTQQIRNNGGEYIQLSISIPIFNRLSVLSNIEKRKNELKRASASHEQTLRDIEAEITRAIADCDGAADAMKQAQLHASLQNEVLTLNNKRFEQGMISPVEYRTISDDYLSATAEYLNAQLQYFIKCCVVRYYAGERYSEQ